MNPNYPDDSNFAVEGLWQRLRLLQRQNDYLHDQNATLQEAIDMICAAFLNNGAGLETAIQAAMNLQQRPCPGSDQIQRSRHKGDMEID
jgi:hypothetical protein